MRRFFAAFLLALAVLGGAPAHALTPAQRVILLTNPKATTAVLVAPNFDDFSGTPASGITGRALITGGLSWANVAGSTSTSNANLTNGAELYTNSAQNNFNLISPPYSGQTWVKRRSSPFQTGTFTGATAQPCMHISYTGSGVGGTNLWNRICFGNSSGAFNTYSGVNLASSSTPTQRDHAATVDYEPGDSYMVRERQVAAQTFTDLYHNDHLMLVGTHDFAADGITLNGNAGFNGNGCSSAAHCWTDFWQLDPATQAYIGLDSEARVMQKNDDGSADIYLQGDYNLGTITALKVSVFDVTGSTETALVTSQPVANLSAGGGLWHGTYHVASGSTAAKMTVRVERQINTAAGLVTLYDYSGVEYFGEVAILDGQSLMQLPMMQTTSGATAAGWRVQGSVDENVADIDQRSIKNLTTNTNAIPQAVMQTQASLASPLSTALVDGAKGGSYLHDFCDVTKGRDVGTANYNKLLNGLARTGNRARVLIDFGLHFEANNGTGGGGSNCMGGTQYTLTQQTATRKAMTDMVADLDARTGYTMKVVLVQLSALGNAPGTGDAVADITRRLWWQLAQDDPTHFSLGPQTYDLQKTGCGGTCDVYHLNQAGFDEEFRRFGFSWAKARGYIVHDRSGPKMTACHLVDSSHVYVDFDIDGGTSIDVVNPAVIPNATLDFDNTSSAFGSKQLAASVAVTSATRLTWTFSGTPFSGGHVWVRGPNGMNPANHPNTNSINASMATLASWIVADWPSETGAPLAPYFSNLGAAGAPQDFLICS